MTKPVFPFFLLFFLGAMGNVSTAQELPVAITQKIDSLFSEVNNQNSPGAAVLIVSDGAVVFNKGYGMANLEFAAPITPGTVFDIASLSKQFVGMAISMLIEEGKLSEQDDIRKHLPEMPDFGHPITVEHLIHHTSGIRDWMGTLSLAGLNLGGIITFKQVLQMAYHQQDLNFLPGSEYCYSNTGYNLLAKIVERVTGERFQVWAHKNIFQPLEMNNSHFRYDYTLMVNNNASGYFWWRSRFHTAPNSLTAIGSSALHTTTEDLGKWLLNFHNPIVGGAAVINRMFKPGTLNNGEQVSYSYGFEIDEYRGHKKVHHSGGWIFLSTYLAYYPEEDFAVVILNNHLANTRADARKITDLFLPVKSEPKTRQKTHKMPVSVLQNYTGTYRLRPGRYLEISVVQDTLMTQATNEERRAMTATTNSKFWVEDYGNYIEFLQDNSGQVTGLKYQGRTGLKVEPTTDLKPEILDEYTGEYFSEELSVYFRVERNEEGLVLKNTFHNSLNLTHVWNEDFTSDQWFINSVEFIRNELGEVSGFLISDESGRSRNQRFNKIRLTE